MDLHIGYEEAAAVPVGRMSLHRVPPMGSDRYRVIEDALGWYNKRCTRPLGHSLQRLDHSRGDSRRGARIRSGTSFSSGVADRSVPESQTDKASGIVNDPNDWGLEKGDPRYIIDLVKRITTVSVETVSIVRGLPPLEEGA